jgi:hypothetical protein
VKYHERAVSVPDPFLAKLVAINSLNRSSLHLSRRGCSTESESCKNVGIYMICPENVVVPKLVPRFKRDD